MARCFWASSLRADCPFSCFLPYSVMYVFTRCGRGSISCLLLDGLLVPCPSLYASSSIFVSLLIFLFQHCFGMVCFFFLLSPWVGCKGIFFQNLFILLFFIAFLYFWGARDIALVGVFQQVRTVCDLEVLTILLGCH